MPKKPTYEELIQGFKEYFEKTHSKMDREWRRYYTSMDHKVLVDQMMIEIQQHRVARHIIEIQEKEIFHLRKLLKLYKGGRK